MDECANDIELRQEIDELLLATLALTKTLKSQQQQIDGMLQVFEILLAQPELLLRRRDVVEKFVNTCRHPTPGLEAGPPDFRIN